MKLKHIVIAVLLTILIFIAYFLIVGNQLSDWGQRGQFGDMFGTLNSFFTALAFAGVVYTVLQQNEMIKQNSNQLDHNKEEFKVHLKIQALTTLLNIYQAKYDQLKNINHIEANEIKVKIIKLTNELEIFLTTSK